MLLNKPNYKVRGHQCPKLFVGFVWVSQFQLKGILMLHVCFSAPVHNKQFAVLGVNERTISTSSTRSCLRHLTDTRCSLTSCSVSFLTVVLRQITTSTLNDRKTRSHAPTLTRLFFYITAEGKVCLLISCLIKIYSRNESNDPTKT